MYLGDKEADSRKFYTFSVLNFQWLTSTEKIITILIEVNKVIKVNDRIYFYLRKTPSSNTTLIKGNVNILIDPGYNPVRKIKSLDLLTKEAGIQIKNIDEIWFTHSHPDHTALSYYLLQEKEIKIVCHPSAKGIVKFYGSSLYIGSHAIKADDCFSDGELRNGIKVFFLPGHTNDEVGFSLENILITGDLIATFSFMRPAVLNVPSSDIDDAISSLEKILKNSPDLILPGHGNCSKIDMNLVKEIHTQTVNLRERGLSLINTTHSFIPYFLNLQKILPLFTLRIQERLALLYIIY
ncbi:MAG: MBL fold metallo-hydrolase, partial [candidate division WOR-3 bacterium]